MLARVAEAAPVVIGSDRARVLPWDVERRAMVTVAVVGYEQTHDDAMAFTIPEDAIAELRRMLDDPSPRRFVRGAGDPFIDVSLARFGHRSVSLAPIVVQGETIGLMLATFVDDHALQPDAEARALDALASLADQAGLAIGRLRLLAAAVHAASHDHLTGLPGRQRFHDRVERAIADGRRNGRVTAVGFLDLDGFKLVNDTHGHATGDALLVEVAADIRAAVRETDSVARMAGDEFALLLRDLLDGTAAEPIVAALVEQLGRPYHLDDRTVRISGSVGIALAPQHGSTPDELVRAADQAMYAAKVDGGSYRLAQRRTGNPS